MHSMVGSFSPYTVKRRRVEIVGGYCYRFFQCSFPCGISMLILSILFIIIGASQLIYIIHFNGCNTLTTSNSGRDIDNNNNDDDDVPLSFSSSWKCNRQTIRVLGITFVVTGSALFLVSALIAKYSRSSEENNVIRTPASSLTTTMTQNPHHPPHHPSSHYYRTPSCSITDQNNIIVSIR